METNKGSTILGRGLCLLELLAGASTDKKASELADEMGLHRTSIYRYLSQLTEAGYVASAGNGLYRLGPKVIELASLVQRRMDVRNIAHGVLVRLSEETDCTVHLAQIIGGEVVIVDKIETHRSLPMYSRIGARVPAHCTGVGKALLAFLPAKELRPILDRLELKRYTDNTITDRQGLLQELGDIRAQGFSRDNSEHEEGIVCVASPILDSRRRVVAAASATDTPRKFETRTAWYVEKVIEATRQISRELGHEDREGDAP